MSKEGGVAAPGPIQEGRICEVQFACHRRKEKVLIICESTKKKHNVRKR